MIRKSGSAPVPPAASGTAGSGDGRGSPGRAPQDRPEARDASRVLVAPDPLGPADPFEPFDSNDSAESGESEVRTSLLRRPGRAGRGGPSTGRSDDSTDNRTNTTQRPGRSLKGRALNYLSRREYSRAELSRKLMPFADDADALEALLDSLVRDGWLSDARFAESVVHRRAARMGATRIVSELKRHAVGEALIGEVNAQLRETELARAQAVWRKKYGQLPTTPAERARQARFLAARGFSLSIIGKILRGIEDEWSDAEG